MNENGSNSNVNRKITSIISRTQMIDTEIKSRNDFIKIPASTENNTNPSLYSFFSGLKNVFKIKGIDNSEAA